MSILGNTNPTHECTQFAVKIWLALCKVSIASFHLQTYREIIDLLVENSQVENFWSNRRYVILVQTSLASHNTRELYSSFPHVQRWWFVMSTAKCQDNPKSNIENFYSCVRHISGASSSSFINPHLPLGWLWVPSLSPSFTPRRNEEEN